MRHDQRKVMNVLVTYPKEIEACTKDSKSLFYGSWVNREQEFTNSRHREQGRNKVSHLTEGQKSQANWKSVAKEYDWTEKCTRTFSNRLFQAEGRSSELGDRSGEKEWRVKPVLGFRGAAKWTSLHTEGFQKEKSHRDRTLFKKMLTENFQAEKRHWNSIPLDFTTSFKSRGVRKQKQKEESFIRLTRRFSTETLTWDGLYIQNTQWKIKLLAPATLPWQSCLSEMEVRPGFSQTKESRGCQSSPLGLLLKPMLQGVPLKSVMWA